MIARPTHVKVGYATYDIEWLEERPWLKDHDPSKIGYFWALQNKVVVRLEVEGTVCHEDSLRETLLHEILHACWRHSNMDDHEVTKEVREWVVGTMSMPLIAVLRDNPDVVEYLTKP